MEYEVPEKKDIIGTTETFSAAYWKVMVDAAFKNDAEAISYYNTNFKPHYSPIPTRLRYYNFETRKTIRVIKLDGKPSKSNKSETLPTDNMTLIAGVIAIIIIIILIMFLMR